MSTRACEIIGPGTGDERAKIYCKNEAAESKKFANDIVTGIIDKALDIVHHTSETTVQKTVHQIPMEDCKDKKSPTPLIGTGDQRSHENLEVQEPIPYHPPVEKKNRLTDLVKNSKQVLARIMMSESKMALGEDKQEEEKVIEVIELDCVQISDLPVKSRITVTPEAIPLPSDDSCDNLTSPEDTMDEIGLNSTLDENKEGRETRRMTFPRESVSRARAFTAKCRTLKREAANLKKKKWNVSGKIANFFRKKRDVKNESGTKSDETQERKEAKGEAGDKDE